MKLKAGAICPVCLIAVEHGPALALSKVIVLSKSRVDHGISQSTYEHAPSVSNFDQRTVYMPRYLVHIACLPAVLPLPTKEALYDLEAKSRGKSND